MARAQREKELALAKRMREVELARQAEVQDRRRRLAIAAAAERQQAIIDQRRRQCARHCAARQAKEAAPPAQATESNDEVEAFNRWIGSLFGLQLPTDSTSSTTTPTEKKDAPLVEKTNTSVPAPAPAPAPVAATEKPTATAESAPASTAKEEKKPEFPEAINDLLSSFLGLRVEPESKLGEAVSNKVPEGLNEFLNQFGLEFFPDQAVKEEKKEVTEPSTSTSTSSPAPASTSAPATAPAPAAGPSTTPQTQSRGPVDLADFLNGTHGLPPFVRDILGNVELAFKDRSGSNEVKEKKSEVEGKGKGVAEGEKKVDPTPAPTPAPPPAPASAVTTDSDPEADNKKSIADSFTKLSSIETELAQAKESFTFPTSLSFSSTPSDSPSLLFNKQNKPYHAQNNRLLQLLLQADGVASNGDREVRRKRKEIVKLVEGEIEKLEKKRDEYWNEVKERREQTGEISENESWSTGSTSDHEEVVHVEDVSADGPAAAEPTPESTSAGTTTESESKVDEDKPSTFAEAVKAPESAQAEPELKVESQTEESKQEHKSDKEEGYELL